LSKNCINLLLLLFCNHISFWISVLTWHFHCFSIVIESCNSKKHVMGCTRWTKCYCFETYFLVIICKWTRSLLKLVIMKTPCIEIYCCIYWYKHKHGKFYEIFYKKNKNYSEWVQPCSLGRTGFNAGLVHSTSIKTTPNE
jgi:hypothetical protein